MSPLSNLNTYTGESGDETGGLSHNLGSRQIGNPHCAIST